MNAPAQIKPPAWKRHLPRVDAFCTGIGADERKMRCRVLELQDQATAGRRAGHNWAADQILFTVEQMGLAFALAPMAIHDLRAVGESMADLLTIAAKVSAYGGASG